MLNRRTLLCGAAASVGAPFAARAAYPERPVRILSGNGAGSTLTTTVRIVADAINRSGTSIVVEPKPGAYGLIASREAMEAKPDGYTLVTMTAGSMDALESQGYDPLRDLSYVSSIAELTLLLLTSTRGAGSVSELVARAKSTFQAGKPIAYGYSNTVGKVGAERFTKAAGIDAIAIPYTGREGMMLAQLQSGLFDFCIVPASSARGQVESGDLRVLAVAKRKRSPFLPGVPTIVEAGPENFRMRASVVALAGPRGLAQDVVDFWRATVRTVLNDPNVQKIFTNTWSEPRILSLEEFLDYVAD